MELHKWQIVYQDKTIRENALSLFLLHSLSFLFIKRDKKYFMIFLQIQIKSHERDILVFLANSITMRKRKIWTSVLFLKQLWLLTKPEIQMAHAVNKI